MKRGRMIWAPQRRPWALGLLLALQMLPFSSPLVGSAGKPAATLFLPYFEVALGDPDGATTLFAVRSMEEETTVARVTLWTDWGSPSLSFDLAIPARGTVPINLRDIFLGGSLPVGDLGDRQIPGCSNPLDNPELTDALRASLVARHTGAAAPEDGLCHGSELGGGELAIGFLTIDVLDACSNEIRNPLDAGYFGAGEEGIAGERNVLFGDLFSIDPGENFAQGGELVSIRADASAHGTAAGTSTFYDPFNNSRLDVRAPLPDRWTTRFLSGGSFDGGTELLLWIPPIQPGQPLGWTCGTTPFDWVIGRAWRFNLRGEGGQGIDARMISAPAFAWKLAVGGEILPTAEPFGVLDAFPLVTCDICSPPLWGTVGWVSGRYSAQGRFSVGIEAAGIPSIPF